MKNKLKIALSGGNGLCGSWLSRALLDKGYEVIILDDFSESSPENLDPRAKFYFVDCCDFKKIDIIFDIERPDYCYNMQAHAAEQLSPFCCLDNYQNNLVSIATIKNACVKYNVKKQIVFSSLAIYGHQIPPFSEEMLAQPEDNYAISKYSGELDAKLAKKFFDLEYSIVRPHNFQGKFVNLNFYRNFLAIAARQAINNENITVFSDGRQTRAFSSVKYLCEPLEKLLYTDCEVVNIGADKPTEIIEVAHIMQKIARKEGKDIGITHLPARQEAVHAFTTHHVAREKLNFVDNTDIEELCQEVYDWVKICPKREIKKANYEITKNLPPSWI